MVRRKAEAKEREKGRKMVEYGMKNEDFDKGKIMIKWKRRHGINKLKRKKE